MNTDSLIEENNVKTSLTHYDKLCAHDQFTK